jgi:hypothetical protein
MMLLLTRVMRSLSGEGQAQRQRDSSNEHSNLLHAQTSSSVD